MHKCEQPPSKRLARSGTLQLSQGHLGDPANSSPRVFMDTCFLQNQNARIARRKAVDVIRELHRLRWDLSGIGKYR